VCKTPKMPEVKASIPTAPQMVEAPPEPVEVAKDTQSKLKRNRNPLRIDLAAGGGGGAVSGVNI